MDLERWRSAIESVLLEFTEGRFANADIEIEAVFDRQRDRYLVVNFGWKGYVRLYHCMLHVEIREDRVWIQRNETDRSIIDPLVQGGIPRDRIVVGILPESVWELSSPSSRP